MFRGFVFDLDRTAVPNGARSVQSRALVDAFAALPGHVVAIAATGRASDHTLPITRELGLRHESVVANGAQIIDSQTGEVRWQRLLSQEQTAGVLEVCAEFDCGVHMAGDPEDGSRRPRDQVVREVAAIYLGSLSADLATRISEALLARELHLHLYRSPAWTGEPGLVDLNVGHAEATKQHALEVLFAESGVDGDHMIGVGDGLNDIQLFEVVGHRVAVANADPQLLAVADEIVPAQDEDGLVQVVTRFHA